MCRAQLHQAHANCGPLWPRCHCDGWYVHVCMCACVCVCGWVWGRVCIFRICHYCSYLSTHRPISFQISLLLINLSLFLFGDVGRVKIGYQCALRLLRCGARVIVTSRLASDYQINACILSPSPFIPLVLSVLYLVFISRLFRSLSLCNCGLISHFQCLYVFVSYIIFSLSLYITISSPPF